MRRPLAAAALLAIGATAFPATSASAACDSLGSVDPYVIPDVLHPTHPGFSAGTCANLGPLGVLGVYNLASVRLNDPTYGTGVGAVHVVCHTDLGCTSTGHTGAGWYPPSGDVVVVGFDEARVDAGTVRVWTGSPTGRDVPICVTTNGVTC